MEQKQCGFTAAQASAAQDNASANTPTPLAIAPDASAAMSASGG